MITALRWGQLDFSVQLPGRCRLNFSGQLLFRGLKPPVSVRFCPRQPGAQLTLFTRLRATCRTANCQRFFRFNFHGYTMHRTARTRWSIVTSLFDPVSLFLTYMANIKFVVKVNRGGARPTGYVRRIDRTPLEMTTNRKLALKMGKFTAEDTAKLLQNSRCVSELVQVSA